MSYVFSLAMAVVLGAPFVVAIAGGVRLIRPRQMAAYSLLSAGAAWVSALMLVYGVMSTGPMDYILGVIGDPEGFHFTIGALIDNLSVLMIFLITSVGLIVQKFSIRYLQGDRNQAEFFSWLSFTLFSVTLFVVSRNILALTLSWFLVSYGVHRLLLYFPQRAAAQKAAWRKFIVSRIGDVVLISALVITYQVFGTFELKDIFAAAANPGLPVELIAAAGSLYVIGAMTKSAQFPFHIWLPDTMEAPTPVSALMHAGIINAGGFLIIRLSPIIAHASVATHVLFAVGAITTLFGGLIYMVQTDVKRSLAYSTIAQMGYMMMQCGLGAFPAAMLHLVMHGFYKANAFLGAAGNVSQKPLVSASPSPDVIRGPLPLVLGAASGTALLALSLEITGVDPSSKAGGFFICLFLLFTATQAIVHLVRHRAPAANYLFVGALALSGMVLYWTFVDAMGNFLEPVVGSQFSGDPGKIEPFLLMIVALVFSAVYCITELARHSENRRWAKGLYVLCLNHFYIEQAWQQTVLRIFGGSRFMPDFQKMAGKSQSKWNTTRELHELI